MMWAMSTSSSPARRPYHHGHLREALIEAGYELARAGGPEAVVIREASRRVGVSHNAAYRHFPDRDSLVSAVGARCMAALARLMEELIDTVAPADVDPLELARLRLRATGRAYVRFALTEPGLFRTGFTAFRKHPLPGESSVLTEEDAAAATGDSGLGPFDLLGRQLDDLVAAGGLPAQARPLAEFPAWSAVHGFSMLVLEGPLRDLPAQERDLALERTLDAIEQGLSGPR